MENKEGLIWYNGDLIDWKDAKLHLLSHGLHYASSVFEGERAYSGKIFKLKEHTERLLDSANQLDLKVPYTLSEIKDACYLTLKKNNLNDAYVRPIIWRGAETMGVSAPNSKIHCAIAVWEWPSYFNPEDKLKGIKLTLSKWKRPSPETIPCKAKAAGLYMICTLSKQEAESRGYDDALMLDWKGQVAEATGANIFFIVGNEIHTPVPDCFLDGITRRTVIEIAKEQGLEIIERKIEMDELSDFEQCFITGTAAEVTPVSGIDNFNFSVGDQIIKLSDSYIDLVNNWDGD
ncbi:MAG: branched-chain amino acid aminotransferase [Pseudomonadota bacterium]|nr:branched-chain amino acid aminotransferase [Pseudomonadota bacterium]MEC7830764.1 branched-chain amino acid aminotransferase [Pseudomonadota bacterium]MEC9382656.1 branched-chain amino acid aminotransferase [Pseudomonadota bacterium]